MSENRRNWYALFVRSRHEFVTSEQLKKRGVEVFLPSVRRMRRWSDRNKAVIFPLFPGYLFVHIEPKADIFLSVVRTYGSVSFVTQEIGRPAIVDRREMDALRMMTDVCDDLDLYPHICAGRNVVVMRGPLKGAEGVVMEKEGKNHFLININILGRSVGTRMNAEDIDLR